MEQDKKAAKTTIVGGQPPGNERRLPTIPVGIEQLLAMAAVNDGFAAALRRDRQQAVRASGVQLSATEAGILAAIDAAALEQMVARVENAIPEPDRRAFLSRSAAALLALAAGTLGTAVSGCERQPSRVQGIRPQRPDSRPEPARPQQTEPHAAPKRPDLGSPTPSAATPASPDAGRPAPAHEAPIGGLQMKDFDRPTRGIRPDRPIRVKGIRPDRPLPTRGIQPDRPDLVDPFGDKE